MQLSYRGISYESQTSSVEAVETQQTGLFLGQSFRLKHVKVAPRSIGANHLKYRGVHYTQA